MVLDPMTGEEQEPQDLRIAVAHKVKSQVPLLLNTSQDIRIVTSKLSEWTEAVLGVAAVSVYFAKPIRQGQRQAAKGNLGYHFCRK